MAVNESNPQDRQDLASRLHDTHVGLRSDLEIHRHIFREEASYVIRDPLNLQHYRVSKHEYQILSHLTDDKSLSEIFAELVATNKIKESEEESFYEFVFSLHQQSFLNLPVSNDKVLYRRYQNKVNARRKSKLIGFLFLQIPLFNPDTILDKTVNWFRPLFTKTCFIFWLFLMAIGNYILIAQHEALLTPMSSMFTLKNIIIMWTTLIILKVIHEFGHAYACKIHNGYVPEIGIYLIAFTPCAYVDVTSSWGFTRKRDRIIVGLGGIYFESYIALFALFTWAMSSDPFIKMVCHNTFFMASLITLFMNINPLMRFDGYYILSDLIEVPNLRSRSQKFVKNILKRTFLGIETEPINHSRSIRSFLFIFGIASTLYRIFIVMTIAAVIATKAFIVGIMMAIFYLLTEIVKSIYGTVNYLWRSPEAAPVRRRAIIISIILLVGVPFVVCMVPIPSHIRPTGLVVKENETIIRSPHDGFINYTNDLNNQDISSNIVLAKLTSPAVNEKYLDTKARLESSQLKLDAYRNTPAKRAFYIEQKKIHAALKEQLKHRQVEMNKLEIYSGKAGYLVNGLKEKDKGRYLKIGDEIGTIISGNWMVKAYLTDEEIASSQPQVGQKVEYKCKTVDSPTLKGKIIKIAPAGSHSLDMPALTNLADGNIEVDLDSSETKIPYFEVVIALEEGDFDKLRYGMTGEIKLRSTAQALGLTLTQKIMRFTNKLHQN